MADTSQIQYKKETPVDRNAPTKRCDGTMVPHALLDATDLQRPARLQGVVLQPIQPEYQQEPIT